MDELLTVRQLQDLLYVDRVTIYRMLESGQLPGFKVGGQWRFSRREIDTWLREQRTGGSERADDRQLRPEEIPISDESLPLSCMDPIQEIFAEAMQVAALTIDEAGRALTPIKNGCAFCEAVQSTEEGRRLCEAVWQDMARSPSPERGKVCHAGLHLLGQPVELGGKRLATALAGQYIVGAHGTALVKERIPFVARATDLKRADLDHALSTVHQIAPADAERLMRLLRKVALAFAELAHQRVQLLARLRRIADIASLA